MSSSLGQKEAGSLAGVELLQLAGDDIGEIDKPMK